MRPSLLDGERGFGASWLRRVASLPVHAYPADATGRIAALHVDDLGDAIARLALHPPPAISDDDREFGLGGDDDFALAEYLAALRDPRLAPALRLPIPGWIARLASHACDGLHFRVSTATGSAAAATLARGNRRREIWVVRRAPGAFAGRIIAGAPSNVLMLGIGPGG